MQSCNRPTTMPLPGSDPLCNFLRRAQRKAAIVSVGFAVAPVGNVPLPTRYRLSWSCEHWNELTTESSLLNPMR